MSEETKQPVSLGAYRVPGDRESVIKAHIATLSGTAQTISDELAFGADVSEITAVLEDNAEDAVEGDR